MPAALYVKNIIIGTFMIIRGMFGCNGDVAQCHNCTTHFSK